MQDHVNVGMTSLESWRHHVFSPDADGLLETDLHPGRGTPPLCHQCVSPSTNWPDTQRGFPTGKVCVSVTRWENYTLA